MSDDKYKQFWIPKDYECDFRSGIHVIEYEAYEQLKEIIKQDSFCEHREVVDKLKAAYESANADIERLDTRLKAALNENRNVRRYVAENYAENAKLSAQVEELVEALGMIDAIGMQEPYDRIIKEILAKYNKEQK